MASFAICQSDCQSCLHNVYLVMELFDGIYLILAVFDSVTGKF